MRFDPPPRIAAVVDWLPPTTDTAAAAVAGGRVTAENAAKDGYLELPVSDGPSGPEMAVLAAAKAIGEAGCPPESIGLVVHAWIYHQGHDFWSPAHYVAQHAGAVRAVPLGVQQMCNGGATAVELAAVRLAADPALERALVTTGDRFAAPGFDRWQGDYGVAYGDGATALVLDRERGPYRLLAAHTAAAPDLESMHRGHDAFSPAPRANGETLDIRRTKKAFLGDGLGPHFAATAGEGVARAVRGALADAGLAPDDPRLGHLLLPRLGRTVLETAYLPAVERLGLTGVEVLDLGTRTGHLGAGDAAAGLAHLHTRGLLEPGRIAILLSAGAGFTWTALLVAAE
ncbi:3-oxoacyl-[acyl-carrier-protein] synthase III C-terminal domain-containing protein [Kitasatospora sp. NPDC059088]|uniref:3-oxoacyl-[acyl-carrier-protein] synthase III C-terminal domain-containing protein n=1 Tax=unclassified Kitasatospora TaxID=2633591 RepID=UPI0036C53B64